MPAKIGKQFQRFGMFGGTFGGALKATSTNYRVLPTSIIGSRSSRNSGKRFVELALSGQRFGHPEQQAKMRIPAHQLIARAIGGRFRLAGLQLEIDEQVGHLAARIGFRMFLQNLDGCGVLLRWRRDLWL